MPVNEKITIDESQIIAALEKVIKKFDEGEKKSDQWAKAMRKDFSETGKSAGSLEDATDGIISKVDELVKKEQDLNKTTLSAKDAFKGVAKETTIFGVNIGQTVDQLQAKINALKGVQAGLKGTAGGFRLLKVAIASTGIGALIVALGSLVTYFTRTQRGIDAMNRAFAAANSVIDNVIDRVSRVGEGLSLIASGQYSKGIDSIRNSFKGLGDEIRNDIKATDDLTKRSQALRDAQDNFIVTEEKIIAAIERKRFLAKDESLSLEERQKNLKEALDLEAELANERTKLAQENLDIIRERNKLSESTAEDIRKEKEAEAELFRIQAEQDRRSRESKVELQSLRKQAITGIKQEQAARQKALEEETKRIQELADAYQGMIEDVDQRIADAKLEELTGEDRLRAERDLALQEIDILEAKAQAAAEAAGVAYDAEKKFYELRQIVQENFEKEIREGRGVTSIAPVLDPKNIQAQADTAAIELPKSIEKVIQQSLRSKNPFERLKDSLKEALDIDDDQLDTLVNGLNSVFSTIKANVLDNLDAQLEANDKLLDSIRAQTESVQAELEKQQDYKEQGFANDVTLNKMRLAELQKEEKKALEERQKIQKQQNAIDTVQQVASLITASANIFKSFSQIPIVGVPLAIAAIATMFGTFVSAKSRAARAARAYKGGPLGDYLGGERTSDIIAPGGASDIPGRGDGYRVEGTNLRLGGDEFVVQEGPAREHLAHLRKLNAGKFKGMDLERLRVPDLGAVNARFAKRQINIDKAVAARSEQLQLQAMTHAMTSAIQNNTIRIVSAIEKQKQVAKIAEGVRAEVSQGGSVIEIVKTL